MVAKGFTGGETIVRDGVARWRKGRGRRLQPQSDVLSLPVQPRAESHFVMRIKT